MHHSLLKNIKSLVQSRFPDFGVNKKQEIERLIYEICKRDSKDPQSRGALRLPYSVDNFENIKKYLLKIRFPYAYAHNELTKPYLPKLKIDSKLQLDITNNKFYPKQIFIESSVSSSSLSNNFKKAFPDAKCIGIDSLKNHLNKSKYTIKDYNKRRDTIFITLQNYDLFKRCPCTKGAIGCGYNIFNLSFGCIFDCSYCYLQEYVNSPGIIFPANIDNFFDNFTAFSRLRSGQKCIRIGTGEFSDSLMLDNISQYSLSLIDFFNSHPEAIFEFKTKSKDIDNLLKINHKGNIVTAWSLNPQKIIYTNEFFTASLKERISSASKCVKAGYKTAFHFDPIIYFNGWEKEYENVIEMLFAGIKPKHIAWISLGTFRFKPELKPIIENRFPGNKILDEELLLGYDNKLRYPSSLRYEIYQTMLKMLKKHSKNLNIYLCMEENAMWEI